MTERTRTCWSVLVALAVVLAFWAGPATAQPDGKPGKVGKGLKEAKEAKAKKGNPGEMEVVNSPFKKAPRPIIGAMRVPLEELPQIENFRVIGQNPLPHFGGTVARGRNGPTGLYQNCFYVGNRLGRRTGTGPNFGTPTLPPDNLIVDISDPTNPQVVGEFLTILGATSRELRVLPAHKTLIILNFASGADDSAAVNNFQVFDISDCREPEFVKFIDVGDGSFPPHEFFVWRDPFNTNRYLLYVSVTGGTEEGGVPSLRVYEFINPPNGPVNQVASFTLRPAIPGSEPVDSGRFRDDHFRFTNKPDNDGTQLHSMTLSDDGRRLYMADSDAGYYVLNTDNLAFGVPCIGDVMTSTDPAVNANPNYCLRLVNPNPFLGRIDKSPPYGGIAHGIYPVPGKPYAVTQGERNGTTTCPWAWGEILDLSDEMNPHVAARFFQPENLPQNCFIGGPGDPALQREFSTHQPLVFPNIFFIAWYSAGFRAWDINIPELPMEVGVFAPRPEAEVIERFRQSPDVWMWPHPFLHNGLFYSVDENSGLYILRYTGARADELPTQGTFHSNDNFHMFE